MFHRKIRDGVELRMLEERDAEQVFALTDRNRAFLRQWLGWVDSVVQVEDTRRFISASAARHAARDGFQAGIWVEGGLAGVAGFRRIDWPNRQTEIGYWLGEGFQGRGLATEACRAIVDHAFRELGLNRVEIRCAAGNVKSCAVPQRLGFTREGCVRQAEWLNDRFVDVFVYGILAGEWYGY